MVHHRSSRKTPRNAISSFTNKPERHVRLRRLDSGTTEGCALMTIVQHVDPGDLIPIGEFSKRSNLTIHQLRHYHEVGLLEPRRVDSESGYRYYSPLQVQTAELIAILRSLDLPLSEIRELLQNPSRANVSAVLDRHRQRLEARFSEASTRLQTLAHLLKEGQLRMQLELPREVTQVRVDGVRVHVPTGQHAVILVDEEEERHLSIWIGMAEATAIATRMQRATPERPLTHDLLATCLTTAGLNVRRVTVWCPAERPQLYLAAMELVSDTVSELIDARPSDAINVALRTGAPIFVANQTLAAAGVSQAEAEAPSPRRGTPVHVVSPRGDELVTVDAFEQPKPGFRLRAEFEVTDVEPLQEGGYRVVARPVVEQQAFMYRPQPPLQVEGA